MEKPRILVVEDDLHMLGFLKSALERNGFVSLPASDCERALRIHARRAPDLAILDYKLTRDGSGLELARLMRRQDSSFPVILITAFGTEDLAIEALREGIDDYLRKPFLLDDLLGSIQRLLPPQAVGPDQTPARPPDAAADLVDGEKLVGDSAGICDIKRSIKKLARGDSSVLILGETGTGKELVAELIHMVTSPAGKQYVGNQKTGGGMTFDTKNNVEVVHVQKPVVGTWRIEVVGSNVPQGPQDFALVCIVHLGE